MEDQMVTDDMLDHWRMNGTLIRVVRDYNPENDVIGWIAAWNEKKVLIRKRNKKVVEIARTYTFQHASTTRQWEVSE